jgi:replication-associated recombination protein RarA
MLHAAAIVGRAGALVFFGPSGSGKTTVAELIGEDVITDEITAIRPAATS